MNHWNLSYFTDQQYGSMKWVSNLDKKIERKNQINLAVL